MDVAIPRSETSPAEARRVPSTIDTELTWRPGRNWADRHETFDRSYEAAEMGVRYQLRVLAQYALKACFFVVPLPLDRPCVLSLRAGLRHVGRLFEQIWSNKLQERG